MFFSKPFPRKFSDEMNKYIDELEKIAKEDDFLSERPIGPFDRDCRHIRAREIGQRIFDIGGAEAMEWMIKKISKKSGKDMAAHLEYCWYQIGNF